MSANLLRRAADLIEQRAGAASGDRWEAVENYPDAWVIRPRFRQPPTRKGVRNPPEPDWYVASESSLGDIPRADVEWMATLGPQVAAPLASWLRDRADCCAKSQALWEAGPQWLGVGDDDLPPPMTPEQIVANIEHHYRHELAFARTIIGATS